jgi:hypothetical protein
MQMHSKNSLLRRIRLPLSQATIATAARGGWRRLFTFITILMGCACMLSAQPTAVSVTPTSGSGGSQVFTAVFTDTKGGDRYYGGRHVRDVGRETGQQLGMVGP